MPEKPKKVWKAALLCVAFAIVTGIAIQGQFQARDYARQLRQGYVHAFSELTTATEELASALSKASYTTDGPLRDSLYLQVYAKALAAQYALGELPLDPQRMEKTAAFFARTGDYAAAIARDGGDDSAQALAQLAQASQALSAAFRDVQGAMDGGALDLAALARAADAAAPASNDAFQDIEAEFPELPTMIYDGPFSEHLSKAAPKALEGLGQVTQEQAVKAAAQFLRRDERAFTLIAQSEGKLPTYGFSLPQNGGTAYVEVTCQGGKVLSYFQDRQVKEARITPEQAVDLARGFLAGWGYTDMEPSYHLERDGALVIHFAPRVDGVYCYPDLVKVTIALDNGTLLGFEAHGYLSCHRDRAFPDPAVSWEEAAGQVPEGLTVLSGQMALIPTVGGTDEVLTWEFKCQAGDGSHVLVYVNALTGRQQNILLLLEDETGTLTL